MDLKYMTGAVKAIDALDSGGFTATITTPRVDLDGEIVEPRGLRNRDEYLTNPLVYWAHEWVSDHAAEPIAKATDLSVYDDRIDASAIYAPTTKAQNVRALVAGGFVSRTSIAFDVDEVDTSGPNPRISGWSLMEYSIVPMPANLDAQITGVKSAIRWLADQWGEDRVEPAGLLASAQDAGLAIVPDEGGISVLDRRHIVLTIRRRPTLRLRAAWSAQYINDLPDSAFACVNSSGRHYPHHDQSGALDLPHLRAALSRIGDPSNEQCGRGHLEAHARAAGVGE